MWVESRVAGFKEKAVAMVEEMVVVTVEVTVEEKVLVREKGSPECRVFLEKPACSLAPHC